MGRTKISRGSLYLFSYCLDLSIFFILPGSPFFFHIAWFQQFFPYCLVPTIFSILKNFFFRDFPNIFQQSLRMCRRLAEAFFSFFEFEKILFQSFLKILFNSEAAVEKDVAEPCDRLCSLFELNKNFSSQFSEPFFNSLSECARALQRLSPAFSEFKKILFQSFLKILFNSDADVEKDVAEPCDRLVHFLNFEKTFSLKVSKNFFQQSSRKKFWKKLFL